MIAIREFMNLTNALADPTRVRVLLALRRQELCACQLTELCGLAQSTMSRHLYLLAQAGLVNSRKDGRWVFYALPGKEARPAVQEAMAWVRNCLADDRVVTEDVENLKRILKQNPTELCKKQCRK